MMSQQDKIIGQCFQNGREISSDTFDELTNEAIASEHQDGIFETLKLVKGELPRLFLRHQQRLLRNVKMLYNEADMTLSSRQLHNIENNFHRQITILSKCIDTDFAVLRYQLILERQTKTLINLLKLRRYEAAPTTVDVQLSNVQMHAHSQSDGRKSIDRRIYAKASATIGINSVYDVLLHDSENNILEGTKTNVFLLNDNTLTTPDLALGGVAGVLRAAVIEQALAQGLNVSIAPVTEAQLSAADVACVSNAVMGLRPVKTILDAYAKRTKYELKSDALAYKNLLELIKNI